MLAVLAILFVLSGAAGLFYEAVWSRYLSLFVGHDAYAQVLTLVIFLGGMALGAWVVSRRSARLADPLFAYALVEVLIGLLGLLFHDGLYGPLTGWAYDTLFPALGGGFLVTVSKWSLAGLLILPQSVLLGATFPLMSAGALRRIPDRPGRTLAILYFSNSLGAAAGVLVAGFVLYRVAGLPGTLVAAGSLNLLVALGALIVGRARRVAPPARKGLTTGAGAAEAAAPAAPPGEDGPGSPAVPGLPPEARGLVRLMVILAAGTAVASFVYEVGWIRMLSLVFGSSTHSFELMLSAFILGLALGAGWVRRRADRFAAPLRALALVQLVMGALAIASLPLYLRSFEWTAALLQASARTEQGYVFFTIARYLLCLAIMLPATFCAGMTLPLMTRMLLGAGAGERAIGVIYSANTLGSIVGAALTGLVLIPALGLKTTLVAGGALDMALGLLVVGSLARSGAPAPRLALAGGAALVLTVLGGLFAVPWDQGLLASGVFRVGRVMAVDQREMLYHADGRTATVHGTRFRATGTRILSTNGKPDGSLTVNWFEPCDTVAPARVFSGDDGTQVMLSLLTLAHAPGARTGAVIGHGTGMSSHVLLGSPLLTRLTTIEIEPAMIAGARIFYPANRRVFDDPRSRVVIDDAKSFFAGANQRFDLILSEPSNPWVSGVSGLFTWEFYARVRNYLTPGGVFGQWLHTYELNDGLVLSILAALHENFADYRVFLINGGDLLVVASSSGPLRPADWSVVRLPEMRRDLCRFQPMTDAALERTLVLDRGGLAPLLARGLRPNSDFYPVLDLGAERARFLQQTATGLATLGSGVVDYLGDRSLAPRQFDTTTVSALTPAPKVKGMLLAAEVRRADADTGWSDGPGYSERYLYRVWLRQMAGNLAPASWRGWIADFWAIRRSLHGGGAPPDTGFFARAEAYLRAAHGPAPAVAAVELGRALAARELPGAAGAVETLLAEARQGRFWLPPDDFLDGAVRVLLAAHQADRARTVFDALRPYSTRAAGDLRLALLDAYIEAARPAGR